VSARRRGGKRHEQVLQPDTCLRCGGADHTSATCPLSEQLGDQRLLRSTAYRAASKEARAVAKKKHRRSQQESKDYKEMPRQRAKAPIARSDVVLKLAPPHPLTKIMIEDGLCIDLQGQPCTKPGCNKEDSVLGQLVGAKTVDFCKCRARYGHISRPCATVAGIAVPAILSLTETLCSVALATVGTGQVS
jgi:hypothetical protein